MTGEPLVSTILTFLNAERFIEEAIASVFSQTYGNWELLLVDDGSSDRSSDIARRYAREFPQRVRYLEHEGHQNRRISTSRNLGIRHATGKYIALIDADDVWLPLKLERQVAILEANPTVGMVYGAPMYWQSATEGGKDYFAALGVSAETVIKPPTVLTLQLAGKAFSPCPSDVLLRHGLVNAIGGFEDGFDDLFEDQAFFAKVALRSPIFVSDECWDKYRLHPDSYCAVATKAGRLQSAREQYLKWLEAHMLEHGIRDRALWRALRRQRWVNRHPSLARLADILRRLPAEPTRPVLALARRLLPSRARKSLRARFTRQ